MKPIKINDDILLVEDILTPEEMSDIKIDISKLKQHISDDPNLEFNDTVYKRIFLDMMYINNRSESSILSLIEKILFSDKMKEEVDKLQSYPFQSYNKTSFHETQLTVYGDGGKYTAHRDNDKRRLFSYVLPVDMVKRKWTGGNTIIIYDGKEITVTPKNNQLLLFSSHLLHSVTPIIIQDGDIDIFAGRVVVNGHIGFTQQ